MRMRMNDNPYKNRLSRVLQMLESYGAEMLISERSADIHYFTGCPPLRGAVLVIRTNDNPLLVVPSYSVEEAIASARETEVLSLTPGEFPVNRIPVIVPRDVKVLTGQISLSIRKELENLRPAFLKEAEQPLLSIQRRKEEDEIEKIMAAVRIAEIGIQAASRVWRVAARELDIAAEADYAMRKAGSEGQWFATHVATGKRSIYTDAAPTRRRLESGEMGFIDVGPLFDHYTGDLTRSFLLGRSSPEQMELLTLVRTALQLAVEVARAGVSAIDLYNSVADFFFQNGKGDFFPTHLGHGLGLLGPCPPVIDLGSEDILESGDIIALEPGLYVPGIGGCRMEDIFRITDDGCEPISLLEHLWEID